MQSFQPSINVQKSLDICLTTSKKEDIQYTQKYLEIPENTPEYPELPESKKDTRKYPIVYFNTPTRPEPDPLPGIFSNTRPDPILKNPTRWALLLLFAHSFASKTILINVLNKIPGSGSGSGRVGVSIGYFRVSFLLQGISRYVGYFQVFPGMSGISGYCRVYKGILDIILGDTRNFGLNRNIE